MPDKKLKKKKKKIFSKLLTTEIKIRFPVLVGLSLRYLLKSLSRISDHFYFPLTYLNIFF